MRLIDASDLPPTPREKLAAGIQVEFRVPPDSAIFKGHYPHFPLLPGVYFVEAAIQLLEAHRVTGAGQVQRLVRVTNLRLSGAAPPGIAITLALAPAEADPGEQAWLCLFSHGERALARFTLILGRHATRSSVPAAAPLIAPVRLAASDIVKRLAHRWPILLIDRASVAADGRALQAYKLVSLNELCYAQIGQASTPEQLGYPSSLLIESFVQACALLVTQLREVAVAHEVMILGGIRQVRFHGQAKPGECVRHDLSLQRWIADTALVSGTSRVGSRVITQFDDVLVAVRSAAGLKLSPA